MTRCHTMLHGLLAAVLCCLLVSCIDVREEYWLEADGSGRAEISHSVPAATARLHGGESAIRAMLDDFLRTAPGIRDTHSEVVSDGERIHIRIRCSFANAFDLAQLTEARAFSELPAAARHLLGSTAVVLRGRTVSYRREITVASALPGAALLPESTLAGHQLQYILHLPVAAKESNATHRENSGKTLVWDIPLKQAIARPLVTRFVMDAPLPWHLLAGALVPVLAGGVWLARRNLKTTKR